MNKKILILEPTQTIQTIIQEKVFSTEIEAFFETSFSDFFVNILSNKYDALLINVDYNNPQGFEFVRFVKSMSFFIKIPIALYSTGQQAFENYCRKNSGADIFFNFKSDTIMSVINSLLELGSSGRVSKGVKNDIIKSAISQSFVELNKSIANIDKTVESILGLITEFCEVPGTAIILQECDGPHLYYRCSDNFSEKFKEQYLKVCATDFEKIRPDLNLLKLTKHEIKASKIMDSFNTKEVPLSSYQQIALHDSNNKVIGSINLVREGNFTLRQLDLLKFFSQNASLILEVAIKIKEKLRFEKNIRKAFSRFVPEQIIDDMVSMSEKTDKVAVGEKRTVAILFSDIRSFTSISELNRPEVVVDFLNRYFTIMVNIIKKHGGTIDKFMGDAIMALFGAPVSYEDNSRRALSAASEMREALSSVPLGNLIMPEGMTFNIGIGINYSNVTVGSIGSEEKTDYTVIGDGVNLASRLEGLTKIYGSMIIVSESVKQDIKQTNNFVFRHLDDVKVKGKAQGVPIFAVDRRYDDFPVAYRDSYAKALDLYKQGIFNLAREYFTKAKNECPNDKAASLMLERCENLIANPPEKWDGAFEFHTK
ncbi:MAG: adenylate/guanylate cyclase domain-containing protein [Treponema sp.]|nr:adenylate/guanylate cyclase domain-containing protein [Treponema sp.]